MSTAKAWLSLFLPAGLILSAALGLVVATQGHDVAIVGIFVLGHILTLTVAQLAVGTPNKDALKIGIGEGFATLIGSFFLSMILGMTLMLLLGVTSSNVDALTIVGIMCLMMLGAGGGLSTSTKAMVAGIGAYMLGVALIALLYWLVGLVWPSTGSAPRLMFGAIVLMPLLCIPAYLAALTRKALS